VEVVRFLWVIMTRQRGEYPHLSLLIQSAGLSRLGSDKKEFVGISIIEIY
jgi:hypothetical protein